jgi:hypothetical protein
MNRDKLVIQLSEDIRGLFDADPVNADRRIESMLAARLGNHDPSDARSTLEQLIQHFQTHRAGKAAVDQEIMARVYRLLLGRKVTPDDLTSAELLERLAQSLNTIFDSLNRLISVINLSFNSDKRIEEQTIRQFIGFHLEGDDQTQSLEEYLGRINQAFLDSQEAFKKAAHKQVERILKVLDTQAVAQERSSGFKIGPLRKAKDYQILQEKIRRIRKWFESGRCTEDFLREFEKHCLSLTKK